MAVVSRYFRIGAIILLLPMLLCAASCSWNEKTSADYSVGVAADNYINPHTEGGAAFDPSLLSSAVGSDPEISGVVTLRDYDGMHIVDEAVVFDSEHAIGKAAFTVYNESDSPISAKFAFPYVGNLYWPSRCRVACDGKDVDYDVAFNWTGTQEGANAVERFDENAEYILYTVKVNRTSKHIEHAENAYIGADFILDASKTRIVADGFGYAANAYGAVRIWSFSDGFDVGRERHLFIVGDDIQLDLKAYEDTDLTHEIEFIDIDIERRLLVAREYLLTFSGPFAVYNRNSGDNREFDGNASDVCEAARDISGSAIVPASGKNESAIPKFGAETHYGAYAQALYRAYAKALDEMLEIHYFIPRSELYAKAEARRLNAALFSVEIPARGSSLVSVTFPVDPTNV